MKKSIKLVSSLCVALLAVGAGVALSGANKVSKSVSAASSDEWSIIGSRTGWATDFGDFAYDSVNKFYGTDVAGRFALNISLDKDESFKVRKDNKWDVSIGYGGQTGQGIDSYLSKEDDKDKNFKVKANGDYLITLHTDVSTYEDKSYGFAIAKSYNITVMDGEKTAGSLYYEDYSNSGFTIEYSSSSFPKEGYTLEGLYEEPTFDTKVESGSLATSQNYTLYAKYVEAVADGYYVVGSMTHWNIDPTLMMNYDDQKDEYSLAVTLEVDDEFKVLHHDNEDGDSYYGYEVLESGEGSAKHEGQIVAASEDEKPNMKVIYGGTYTPYFKVSSSTIWIGAIEESHDYEIKVNEDSYELVVNPSNPNEYMTVEAVDLSSGDVLAYFKDEVLQTATPKAIGNNNCFDNDGVTTVCLDLEGKIYVDVKANTIFCGGLDCDKFYMSVNDEPVELTHNESPADPSYIEYFATAYAFEKNDVIKFVDTKSANKNAVVFSVTNINTSSVSGFDVVDDLLKCVAEDGVTCDAYAKFKTDANEVYFGNVSEDLATAVKFAKEFNESLASVCKGQGITVLGQLQSAWEGQARKFADIIDKAKEILKNATSSDTTPDLSAFADKYDYVYSHYSDDLATHGANFASRTVAPAGSVYAVFGIRNGSNTALLIVVISSLIAVSAIGGLFYIRKRRHN